MLWVRAPLSKQVPQASTFLPVPDNETDTSSSCPVPTEFFVSRARPLHDAPPSRCAFKSVLFTGQRFRTPGVKTEYIWFRGTPRFRPPSWLPRVARTSRTRTFSHRPVLFWEEITGQIPGIRVSHDNEREISGWRTGLLILLPDSAVYRNSDVRLPRVPRISLVKDAARGKNLGKVDGLA